MGQVHHDEVHDYCFTCFLQFSFNQVGTASSLTFAEPAFTAVAVPGILADLLNRHQVRFFAKQNAKERIPIAIYNN